MSILISTTPQSPIQHLDPGYMEKYRGAEWLETYTGKQFYPAAPRSIDMNVFDIAHALAFKCRYNGHCANYLSVAEHSFTLAMYARHVGLPVSTQFQLLMHDGAEAYLPDIPRPIKHLFPELILMEKVIDGVVRDWAGLPHDVPPEVKEFDSRIIRDEREQGMMHHDNVWKTDALEKLGVEFSFMHADMAYHYFLQAYQTIAEEFHGKRCLLAFSPGEFTSGLYADKAISVPNISMLDLRSNVALVAKDDGKGRFLHGEFELQSRR